MAYCPECMSEYRKGIKVCADCGCELVEEDQIKKVELTTSKMAEKTTAASFGGEKEFVEEEDSERVFVPTGAYQNSAQKAEDNRSSAWTLLLVGGIGLIVMILGMTGIIPFSIGNTYMFYGVMSAVFLLFIVMGFVSMKNAKFFSQNAESENTLKTTLLEWCKENLTAEKVDSMIPDEGLFAEEVLYLRRYEVIKYMINHQFMNLDQNLVERMIDDEVYDMVFPPED